MFVLHHFFKDTNSTPSISALTLTGRGISEPNIKQKSQRFCSAFTTTMSLPYLVTKVLFLMKTVPNSWSRCLLHVLGINFLWISCICMCLYAYFQNRCSLVAIAREFNAPRAGDWGNKKGEALLYEEETFWQSNSMTSAILYWKPSVTIKDALQNIHSLVSTQISFFLVFTYILIF